jgi:tRNA dimethylallyltransferase
MQSVGYRHAAMVLSGELKTGDALALMQRDTRHLAKRQLTWFRGDTSVRWFHPEAREEILICAKQFLFG